MTARGVARWFWAGLIGVAVAAGDARALPSLGDAPAAVQVERASGTTRTLPDRAAARALLVVYEDRDAGAQNQHVTGLLERIAQPGSRCAVELVAVGDVAAYDFWPARRFVRDDIRKREAREGSTIWLDWRGALRSRWTLAAKKSSFVLLDAAGRVRFASEGSLSQAQVAELNTRLGELGCDLR